MATRRRNISFAIDPDGRAKFSIYTRPDSDGKQSVAEVVHVAPDAIHASLLNPLALYGLANIVRVGINGLENPDASELRRALTTTLHSVREGTWTPGRDTAEREPTDLEIAVAEATGQPLEAVQDRFDNDIRRSPAGEPLLDKKGHHMRIWTARKQRELADDPRIKPILARLAADRAKRLAAEAKRGGGTAVLDMFAPPTAAAAD